MKLLRAAAMILLLATSSQLPQASIVTFTGGQASQDSWRSAVGTFVTEDFQSFATNTTIPSLPLLGLTFNTLIGGGSPGVYDHFNDNTPFGSKQIANFPGNCCITSSFQFGDIGMDVDPGVNLFAFGFWNGDDQGNALLRIFNRSNVLVGTVTALVNNGSSTNLSNSFAGFISTEPIGRMEWEGEAGDGFNHYDGLQASFAAPSQVPEPSTTALILFSLGILVVVRRAEGHRQRARQQGRRASRSA